jgi:putative nucleotidyltransferase with HDIG domain
VDGRITAAVFTVINSGEKDGTEKSDDTLIDVLAEAIIDMKAREVKVQMVRDAFFNMLEDVNESYQELEELFLKLIRVLINVLDAKSPWTKGHSERVSRYAEAIAEEMGLDDDNIRDIKLAGLLHDIGKIGTYDYLLDKPGKLTREEYELVMKHPAQGALILKGIKQLEDILPLIHYHHEKLDGKGYPNGLHGDQIPVGARILHVADSFDSMTSDRPYRKAPGIEFALMEFEKYKGTQFDPQVVDAFMNILDRKIFSTG